MSSHVSKTSRNPANIPSKSNYIIEVCEKLVGLDWYGIYYFGEKVGWGRIKYKMVPNGDRSNYFLVQNELHASLLINGHSHKIAFNNSCKFSLTPPYKLIDFKRYENVNDYTRKLQISKSGPGYRVVRNNSGALTIEQDKVNYSLPQILNLQLWILRNPDIGDTEYMYNFDEATFSPVPRKAVIKRIFNCRDKNINEKCYQLLMPDETGRDNVIIFNDQLRIRQMDLIWDLEYRLEPKSVAKSRSDQYDLYIKSIVPVQKSIGDTQRIKKVQLVIDNFSGELLENATGQKIEKDHVNNTYCITLDPYNESRMNASNLDIVTFSAISKDAFDDYPELIQKMERVVKGSKNVEEKVIRLLEFTNNIVEYDSGVLSPNLQYVLKHRRGDCSELSLMFMALAQYEKIPCRIAGGLAYMGDWARGFGPHQWNEVVIDHQWVPVDPSTRSIPINPVYIRFPDDVDKRDKLMEHLPNMSIEIKSVLLQTSTLND